MADIVPSAQNLTMNKMFKKDYPYGLYILVGGTRERQTRKDIVDQMVISALEKNNTGKGESLPF